MLNLAERIASWSRDPSTKVGAVIADSDNRIISTGYNGFAQGVEDSDVQWKDRETKYELVIHGEENALIFAQRSIRGCTLYTVPFPPCSRCASKFIQAGISRVVARPPTADQFARWEDSFQLAKKLYKQAKVEYRIVTRGVT